MRTITRRLRFLGQALLFAGLLSSCATPHRVELCRSGTVAAPVQWVFGQVYQVRVFRTNSDSERFPERLVKDNGRLIRDRSPRGGVVLDQAQEAELRRLLNNEGPEIGNTKCVFRPHHAVIFYDRDGSQIGSVDICFLCSEYVSSVDGLARYLDYVELKKFFQSIGLED